MIPFPTVNKTNKEIDDATVERGATMETTGRIINQHE